MADAAVTFLLETVKQLLESYVDLISSAKNEFEQLKNDLDSLKALLEKADDMTDKDQTFKVLERQIREVVHDAEDTIEDCLITLRLEPKRRRWLHGSGSSSTTKFNLARAVKSVRDDKVTPMLKKAKEYIGEGSVRGGEQRPTTVKKVQIIREDNVVGFQDEEQTIVSYLKEEKEKLDVISIVGMPGLGKTTLAWKIFKNEEIQFQFPVRIWVYVSQDFNPKDVFLNILKGFTRQDLSGLSDYDLIQTLRAYLSNGKFLLVIDDLWKKEAWDAINDVLPNNNRMGKVLITSRELNVGKHANGAREPHRLRFLNDKESWELLQLEVFGKLDDCPQQLEEIGNIIARQCQGLPLSLVVIGGILLEQDSSTRPIGVIQNAWKEVSENVNEHVSKDERKRPSDMVALSYKNLPQDMRNCFVYLGVFPEGYEISVWTLTRLWVAEGFVQPNGRRHSLEEIAEGYVKDLINRNLLMAGKTSAAGEVKTCRVHDVIREFCKSKASILEKNMFLEIKKSGGVFQPQVSDIEKCRRLCIYSHLNNFLEEFLMGTLKAPLVRSFLYFSKDTNVDLESKYLSKITEAFRLLRVLDSKSIKFNQFPPKVHKLIHLRYITLCVDNLNILPPELSSLWNLQTLVADTKSRVLEVKANLWKMIQLRHVKTKAEIMLLVQAEKEDRGGENIQTLNRLSPKHCTPDVFKRARNLKRLGVRGDLNILLDNGKSFGDLDFLETLKLKHDLAYQSPSEEPMRGLPQRNYFPRNIKRLTLSTTYLDWADHMPTLGQIGTLEVLKLKDNAFVGPSWKAVSAAGFPRLQFLLIENINFFYWEASDDHFPSLWCLVLKNCENLSTIPEGLTKSLQMLKMDNVHQSAIESARKIEEAKKQIQEQKQARRGGFKLEIGPRGR
ncbi:Apoptotic ATPase [Handroanthus impetiginosus]|uniref:Apoptotic ATPase n=1 Tax=Handroanthus impetiginosus TaxID=429701 RepID=A0A2G9GZ18_9LAMI|nr:Apoptotic ATPase [Handroanthus impetiginosus]